MRALASRSRLFFDLRFVSSFSSRLPFASVCVNYLGWFSGRAVPSKSDRSSHCSRRRSLARYVGCELPRSARPYNKQKFTPTGTVQFVEHNGERLLEELHKSSSASPASAPAPQHKDDVHKAAARGTAPGLRIRQSRRLAHHRLRVHAGATEGDGKFVKEFDIKIAIHNHGPEDTFTPTPRSELDAVDGMDPRMGLCIDIGHTARTGADPVEWVEKAGARLHEMHFKDLKDPHNPDWKVGRDSQVAVGEGVLPIAAILKQLAKQKYKGYCSLEYEINAKDPLPGMQKSFDYMRKLITDLKLA
jgi:hypothetical protein